MRATLRCATLALAALALACGDAGTGPDPQTPPPPPPPPPPGDAPMTARLNGDPFTAEFVTLNRAAGQVYVNGAGLPNSAIGFTFPDAGAGSYTIAPGNLVSAGVTIGTTAWVAGQAQGSGTITVSTFTASRIAGTFAITLVASGSGPGMTVTEGVFDFAY